MMKVLESWYIIILKKLIDDFYIDYLRVVKGGGEGGIITTVIMSQEHINHANVTGQK